MPVAYPPTRGEQPGVGTALGAVVGGATGAAVGLPIGVAATLLVPGVGPVIASGLLGAVLFGAGGAAVGSALEKSLQTGLPRDELFVYKDALRRGHSIVVALADEDERADIGRRALEAAGAESVDAARERWWIGLRSAEQERYADGPAAFQGDEALFRRGFEAALASPTRGWQESLQELRARHRADCETPAFRHGWKRGQRHRDEFDHGRDLPRSA
jgi:hypothetical protein